MAQKAYAARFREGFVELEPVRRVIYRWRIGESPPWPSHFDVESVEVTEGREASVYPYPGRRVEDPVYVVTRMLSTRSGKNAWWRAGDKAQRCLNQAPYEPIFRGWVRDFEWAPAANAEADRDKLLLYNAQRLKQEWTSGPESTLIVQGGTLALNWSGWLIENDDLPEAEIREEPHRGHLRLAVGHLVPNIVRENEPDYRQGHLSLYRLKEGDLTKVADYFYPYGRVVFNHYLTGGSGVVAQWHEWFLIRVYRVQCPILSPDHDPVWPEPGWYLARHPVPTARRDAD